MFRLVISASLAVTVLTWAQVVLAAAQPVVLVEVPGAAPDLREKMRVSAEDGLDSIGVTVPRQLRDPKKEECTTPECISERSKRFGATHVLEIQGSYVNESYKMRLDVRAVNGGRVVGSESKECEICSSRDFLRAIKDRTVTLWTRVAREQASVIQPSVAEPSAESKTTTVPLTAPADDEQRRPRSLWQQPIPLLGLGLMLGGVVAMGFGGYYLAVDGEPPSGCATPCAFERDTKRLGWELMAGGGGAILTGTAIVLLGRDSDTSTRVAVGPGRFVLSGRF